MKRVKWSAIAVLFVPLLCPLALSWGITGHHIVTYTALNLVDEPLRGFFEANMETLLAFSCEPDILADVDTDEGRNHYIDLDEFDDPPFDDIPADEAEFVAKFGEEALEKGRLPWAVEERYRALVEALRGKDLRAVLRHAGYLSHYLADATMPLHATKNYKGQYSGNVIFDRDTPDRHVHVRFEIGMIDRHRREIQEAVSGAELEKRDISDPAAEALALAVDAYGDIDAILAADRALLKRGEEIPDDYYERLYDRVGAIARRRLAEAALMVACFWESAWREAGEPALVAGEVVLPAGTLMEEGTGHADYRKVKGEVDD